MTNNSIPSTSSKSKVSRYTIMYKDIDVVTLDLTTDKVTLHSKQYLPFALRNKEVLLATQVSSWITNRVSNLHRTYMNVVYIARGVGRDTDNIIKDSVGISFIDNYWIKTSDVKTTWDELQSLRDINNELSIVALTGKLDTSLDLSSGLTSLFATKGYFSKGVLGGYLVKRREDAVLEYPAYLIAKQLGIHVSECSLDGDYVKIKIFTNYGTSLVHASELIEYFDIEDELYNQIAKIDGLEGITEQMQRMFIFNYIIGNPDLHNENYGVLYNSDFELVKLAPLYDHNVAFQEGFNGASRTTIGSSALLPLDLITKQFIGYHVDIVDGLKQLDLTEVNTFLTDVQKIELKQRIDDVSKWAE